MTRIQPDKLVENSSIKLSVAAALLVFTVTNTFGLAWLVFKYDARVAKAEERIDHLAETKRDKGVNSWNREAHRIWSADLQDFNAGLNVPDPRNLKYISED